MYPDPNPENKKVDKDEKDKRKFTLLLVFILIIGFSLIAGILKFRQARKEVRELSKQTTFDEVPGLRPPTPVPNRGDKSLKKSALEERGPQGQESSSKLKGPRKRLVPSKRDKAPVTGLVKNLSGNFSKLKFDDKYFSIQGADYLELENVVALPIEFKDRYRKEEILGEKNRRVIVLLPNGEDIPPGANSVAYNSRTKSIAVITGILKVQFSDQESFIKRSQYFKNGTQEKSTFDAISLSLLQMDPSLSSLENLEKERIYWAAKPGVKRVSVELLEAEITVK